VRLDPDLRYKIELIADSARHSERFELATRLAEGSEALVPELVPGLITLIRGRDEALQALAARALARGKVMRAVPALVNALRSASAMGVAACADALGRLGDQAAIEPLRALLDDRRNAPRRAAIRALGMLGDELLPGEAPDEADPVDLARYLERLAVLGEQALLLGQMHQPGVNGLPADELPRAMFDEEVAPGLLVDLEHHEQPCTMWVDGKASCHCLSDEGERFRMKLRLRGERAVLVGFEVQDKKRGAQRWRGLARRMAQPKRESVKTSDPVAGVTRSNFRQRAIVYVTSKCRLCRSLISWMEVRYVDYQVRNIDESWSAKQEYEKFPGRGVPLVVIGDQYKRGAYRYWILRSWIVRQLRAQE